jgi:ATP-dependent protease HslVU (ClpYQ) peptidase subunit
VVVRKGTEAVIGADTLAKAGPLKERALYVANASKLVRAGPHWLGVVGHASLPLLLDHYLQSRKRPPVFDSPQAIFAFSLDLHAALRDRYWVLQGEDEGEPFESSQLDALIAGPGGLFGLFALRSVSEFTRFYAIGSGSDFALGAMRAVYDQVDDPAVIAQTGLEAAADFDDSTEAPFELQRVTLR